MIRMCSPGLRAMESVNLTREPFSPTQRLQFGTDGRTHIILFAMNMGLLQGEGANAVTADVEDSAHNIYPLRVVLVAPVKGYEWMTEVVVRLNDQIGDVGDVLVRINIHGVASNRVRVGIGHIGMANSVTAFTLSDFSRTFQPASGGGTDHAWGSHHLVLGGAVRGGDFYGKFPNLALSGPDDSSDEGRWIPTTSVDQYAATLAQWYGLSSTDLPLVFPNLGRFATPNLGFVM